MIRAAACATRTAARQFTFNMASMLASSTARKAPGMLMPALLTGMSRLELGYLGLHPCGIGYVADNRVGPAAFGTNLRDDGIDLGDGAARERECTARPDTPARPRLPGLSGHRLAWTRTLVVFVMADSCFGAGRQSRVLPPAAPSDQQVRFTGEKAVDSALS